MSILNNHITVIGSINADHILSVPRLPVGGETLSLSATQLAAGGKGANQAVAASRNGAKVAFIGATGKDDAGHELRRQLAKEAIDLAGVATIPNAATGRAYIMVQPSGENSILIDHGANYAVTPRQIMAHAGRIRRADFVVAQCEVPIAAIRAAFNEARAAHKTTVLNPAPAPKTLAPSLLAMVDLIVPNASESQALTGIAISDVTSMAQSAAWFHQRGVKVVIITLGARGAYVSGAGMTELLAAREVPVVDTTAAGDTFIGALVAQAKPDFSNLKAAVAYAMAAAALAVQHAGAQPSIPTTQAVLASMAQGNS